MRKYGIYKHNHTGHWQPCTITICGKSLQYQTDTHYNVYININIQQ
jgi:hypothetical protein